MRIAPATRSGRGSGAARPSRLSTTWAAQAPSPHPSAPATSLATAAASELPSTTKSQLHSSVTDTSPSCDPGGCSRMSSSREKLVTRNAPGWLTKWRSAANAQINASRVQSARGASDRSAFDGRIAWLGCANSADSVSTVSGNAHIGLLLLF